jgi:hypothetical protein
MAANSFSTSICRWIHLEAWTDRHYEYFVDNYQTHIGNIAKPIPCNLGRKSQPPQIEGRWILENADGDYLGWVEVTGYYGIFRKSQILFSHQSNGWNGELLDQLAFIISAIMISSKSDLVSLIGTNPEQTNSLNENEWGTSKELWTFNENGLVKHDQEPSLTCATIEIDPIEWWQTSVGRRQKAALSYLQKRITMDEKRSGRIRKKSIFVRMFTR